MTRRGVLFSLLSPVVAPIAEKVVPGWWNTLLRLVGIKRPGPVNVASVGTSGYSDALRAVYSRDYFAFQRQHRTPFVNPTEFEGTTVLTEVLRMEHDFQRRVLQPVARARRGTRKSTRQVRRSALFTVALSACMTTAQAADLVARVRIPERTVSGTRIVYAAPMSPVLAPSLPLMELVRVPAPFGASLPVGTPVPGCGPNRILFGNANAQVDCNAEFLYREGDPVTNGAVSLFFGPTQSATPAGLVRFAQFSFTPTGTDSNLRQGIYFVMLGSGFTGAADTSSVIAENQSAAVNANWGGNGGLRGGAIGTTTGHNFGVHGYAQGSSTFNVAVMGKVGTAGAGDNIGVVAEVPTSGGDSRVALYAALDPVAPTLAGVVTAALFDNAAQAVPSAVWRDNGTEIFRVDDNGVLQGSRIKALVSATATSFLQIAVPSADHTKMEVTYQIYCADATNRVARGGRVQLNCINTAGTEVCSTQDTQTTDAGSGGATFSVATIGHSVTPTNAVDLQMTATCSLTETTLQIEYWPPVVLNRQAVTPQ